AGCPATDLPGRSAAGLPGRTALTALTATDLPGRPAAGLPGGAALTAADLPGPAGPPDPPGWWPRPAAGAVRASPGGYGYRRSRPPPPRAHEPAPRQVPLPSLPGA